MLIRSEVCNSQEDDAIKCAIPQSLTYLNASGSIFLGMKCLLHHFKLY